MPPLTCFLLVSEAVVNKVPPADRIEKTRATNQMREMYCVYRSDEIALTRQCTAQWYRLVGAIKKRGLVESPTRAKT